MNDQILELAASHFPRDEDGNIFASPEVINEFAQAIVRECAKICVEKNVINIDLDTIHKYGKFTLLDIATKSCGNNLAKRIKKHFGCE